MLQEPAPVKQEIKGIEHLPVMLAFLNGIGIETRMETIHGKTFVPGLRIENGVILIDKEKLLYPGDLLHEAGHIAVTASEKRAALNDITNGGEEMATILWSYAALKKLGLPLELVFHPHGYKGDSAWFIENFRKGIYVGLPYIEWIGLAAGEKKAKQLNIAPFPNMIRWMRE